MSGFRLGRLFAIPIRVELDWFIGAFLMAAAFALVVFPVSLPGAARLIHVLLACLVTLIFYMSLLVHEYSHALMARRHGLQVQSITLHILGGIAHLRGEPKSPREEVVITSVGPVTSAALAVGFGGVAVGAVEIGASPAVTVVLRSVAVLNAFVAVFNLMPVFPLDGGRLLRALLWRVTGSLDRASRMVIRTSTTISYLLVGLGVWRLFVADVRSGLATMIGGVVLHRAAAGRYRQLLLRNALKGVSAEQIMSPLGSETVTASDALKSVSPRDDMVRVMDVLRESASEPVLVRNGGEVLGIITAADVASWLERARPEES
jgi:Zn-dependent protease